MSSFLIFDIDILFRFGLEGVAVIEASITIFLGALFFVLSLCLVVSFSFLDFLS